MPSSYLSSRNQATLSSQSLFFKGGIVCLFYWDLGVLVKVIHYWWICFQIYSSCWQNSFPCSYKTRLLAKGHPLFLEISCHMALSIGHAAQHESLLLQNQQWRKRPSLVARHHGSNIPSLCHILLVRSNSQVPPHSQGDGYTKTWAL